MMITGHLTLLVTSLGLARAGLLGAGTGEGSCAAPPFRLVLQFIDGTNLANLRTFIV